MRNAHPSLIFPFAIVFFEIATYLANDMYLPGLPRLMADFAISQERAQDTLLYWFLGTASMQLFVGPLSDRFGRKIILLIGVILFSLSSLACAYTTEIMLFLLGRFIQGCAVCSVVVAGYASIHETFETKVAIKIISIMGSVVILAPAFGPILGALVIAYSNWQMIFIILSLWGALSLLLLTVTMPSKQKEVVALHLADIFKDYWRIATRKAFLVFTLPFCFMFLSMISWVVESPFILTDTYHQSPIEFGLIQFYVFGFFIIGAQITGVLVNRFNPITLIKIGIAIASLAALGFVVSCLLHLPLYAIVLCMMLVGLGAAMTFGPLSRFAVEACVEPMGRRMAIFSSYMSFFGVLSTFLVTLVKSDHMLNLGMIVFSGMLLSFVIFFMGKVPSVDKQES